MKKYLSIILLSATVLSISTTAHADTDSEDIAIISTQVFTKGKEDITTYEYEDGMIMTVVEVDLSKDELLALQDIATEGTSYSEPRFSDSNTSFFGADIPSKRHDISKSKKPVAGSSTGPVLYSAVRYYGKSSYEIVLNYSGYAGKAGKIQAKREFKSYASAAVSSGKKTTVTFSGIEKKTEWYLRLTGDSNGFSYNGEVK